MNIALDRAVIEYFKAKAGDRAYWELINDVLKAHIRQDEAAVADDHAPELAEKVA